jgi:hypothetical protein
LSQCYLEEPGSWVLYHAGDFVASKPDQLMKLKFSMAQIDCTHTKGGLCVDSVLIYPKGKGFQHGRVVRSRRWRDESVDVVEVTHIRMLERMQLVAWSYFQFGL